MERMRVRVRGLAERLIVDRVPSGWRQRLTRRLIAPLVAVLVLAGGLPASALAAGTFPSTTSASSASSQFGGTWDLVDTCTSSDCAGEHFSGTLHINQCPGSASFSGDLSGINAIAGTQSGDSVMFTDSGGGYVAQFQVTLSGDGQSFTGSYTDNQGGTGTTEGTRTGSSNCTCPLGASANAASASIAIAPVSVRHLNNNSCDRGAAYYTSTLLNSVEFYVGGVFVPVGGGLVYAGWAGSFETLGGTLLAGVGGMGLASLGTYMVVSSKSAQHDPPDPNFRSLLAVPAVEAVTLHAERGLTARAAKAFAKYVTELHKASVVAGTLATTINRAGGAIVAGNTMWEGRQIRYAIKLTHAFKNDVGTAVTDARSLNRAATGSAALSARVSAAKLRAIQRKYGKRRVPVRLVELARSYGLSASQLRAALNVKLPKHLPKTLLQFLTGPSTLAALEDGVKAYDAWSKVPQIVNESRLT